MAEARERSEWTRTSALLALIANAHRDPRKSRAFRPSDFDPFAQRGEGGLGGKADITALRDVFIDGRLPDIRNTDEAAATGTQDKEAGT